MDQFDTINVHIGKGLRYFFGNLSIKHVERFQYIAYLRQIGIGRLFKQLEIIRNDFDQQLAHYRLTLFVSVEKNYRLQARQSVSE